MTYSQAHQPSDAHEDARHAGAFGSRGLSAEDGAQGREDDDISSSSMTIGVTLVMGVSVMVVVLLLPYIGVV